MAEVHLFTYGTLMFPEVWLRVARRQFRTRWATLYDHAAYVVRDDLYPVLVESEPGNTVCGLIYQDVDEETMRRIDAYESDLYERKTVHPIAYSATDVGREAGAIECQAYFLPQAAASYASDKRWDAKAFASEHLADYLTRFGPV